jgi:cytochrome b6-f complex iron-sulfur subunit
VTAVEPTTDSDSARPRREVLCGLVVALLAPGALAAACGDSGSSSGGGNGGSGGTANGGGSGGATSGGGSGGAAGTVLAALSDVPDGSGLVVNGKGPRNGPVLIVRTGSDVKAYDARCTHQGTTVRPPVNGVITCPQHGSQFDAATGAVKRVPAKTPLVSLAVKVDGTNVVLA